MFNNFHLHLLIIKNPFLPEVQDEANVVTDPVQALGEELE
jgi:hypothetical protein